MSGQKIEWGQWRGAGNITTKDATLTTFDVLWSDLGLPRHRYDTNLNLRHVEICVDMSSPRQQPKPLSSRDLRCHVNATSVFNKKWNMYQNAPFHTMQHTETWTVPRKAWITIPVRNWENTWRIRWLLRWTGTPTMAPPSQRRCTLCHCWLVHLCLSASADILCQEAKKRAGKPKGPLSAIDTVDKEKIQKTRSIKKKKNLEVNNMRLNFLIAKRTYQLEDLMEEQAKNNKCTWMPRQHWCKQFAQCKTLFDVLSFESFAVLGEEVGINRVVLQFEK